MVNLIKFNGNRNRRVDHSIDPYKVFSKLPDIFDMNYEHLDNLFGDVVYENEEGDKKFQVKVPGFNKDNLDVKIEEGVLYVDGKREVGDFYAGDREVHKKFSVSTDIKDVDAKLKDGILYITLKKPEAEITKIKIE